MWYYHFPLLARGRAEAGLDYTPLSKEFVFPAGSKKGSILCIEIDTICDNEQEGDEYFEVVANITCHPGAKFGGSIESTTGYIRVEIRDQCKVLSFIVNH